jgi:flagellar biosynthesis chaperone FliJ
MSATIGSPIEKYLKKVSNVWSIDAAYEDKRRLTRFTKKETDNLTTMLSDAGSIFNKVDKCILDEIRNNKQMNSRINNYINSKVRLGEQINDVESFVVGLDEFIKNYYQKQSDLKKTATGKNNQMNLMYSALRLSTIYNHKDIENVFSLYNILVNIKLVIINKLNKADGLKTLLKTNKGYEVTGQEGFVAIDRYGKNALKLVDRLQFSNANFSAKYIKGWQK